MNGRIYIYKGKAIDLDENGADNPSCPACKHYNALIQNYDYSLKCRDCGIVVAPFDPNAQPAPVEPEVKEVKSWQRIDSVLSAIDSFSLSSQCIVNCQDCDAALCDKHFRNLVRKIAALENAVNAAAPR